jgi:hypothetical protein
MSKFKITKMISVDHPNYEGINIARKLTCGPPQL